VERRPTRLWAAPMRTRKLPCCGCQFSLDCNMGQQPLFPRPLSQAIVSLASRLILRIFPPVPFLMHNRWLLPSSSMCTTQKHLTPLSLSIGDSIMFNVLCNTQKV
jgi:hypothetical protein